MVDSLYPVRELTAEELSIALPASDTKPRKRDTEAPAVDSNDPFVLKIQNLLYEFGGVILSGVPGTSKSWWAQRIAEVLTQPLHRAFVQFHPSYQYEDFIYGYVPNPDAGEEEPPFVGHKGIFLNACEIAEGIAPEPFVLVIDEFSRADVGRVFGEALTYIEDSKRGRSFQIAGGPTATVPKNLLILATMNPFDRGVDEVDAAFERRFAKVAMEPDSALLETFLVDLEENLRRKTLGWFNYMNGHRDTPLAAVGHAYFKNVTDVETLREVWDYQLQYHVERAFRLNAEGRTSATDRWKRIFEGVPGGWDGRTEAAAPTSESSTAEGGESA